MEQTLTTFHNIILASPATLNLVVILLVVAPGVFLWFWYPATLANQPRRRNALELWIVQWLPLVIVYFLLNIPDATFFQGPGSQYDWIILSLLDIQSFLVLGFAYLVLRGSGVALGQAWTGIAIASGFMIFYNVVLFQFPLPPPGAFLRYAFALPSALLATIAFVSFGYVFLMRWGGVAFPLLISGFFYALVQWPIYIDAIVLGDPEPRWFVVLACAKAVLGFFFYLYFLSPLASYEPLPVMGFDPQAKGYVTAKLKGIWGILGTLLVGVIAGVLVSLIMGGT